MMPNRSKVLRPRRAVAARHRYQVAGGEVVEHFSRDTPLILVLQTTDTQATRDTPLILAPQANDIPVIQDSLLIPAIRHLGTGQPAILPVSRYRLRIPHARLARRSSPEDWSPGPDFSIEPSGGSSA